MHAEYIKVNIDPWVCENCNSSLFPFNHMEDEIDLNSCVADMLHCNKMSLSYLSDKSFLPFELNDKDHSILGDTDPKNKQAFIQSIAETDWSEIYNVTSTEIVFTAFHKKLMDLLTKYFPKVWVKKKYHYRKPWLSEALRTSIKHKNKLYHRYTKINSVKSEILYKSYKTKINSNIKGSRKKALSRFV